MSAHSHLRSELLPWGLNRVSTWSFIRGLLVSDCRLLSSPTIFLLPSFTAGSNHIYPLDEIWTYKVISFLQEQTIMNNFDFELGRREQWAVRNLISFQIFRWGLSLRVRKEDRNKFPLQYDFKAAKNALHPTKDPHHMHTIFSSKDKILPFTREGNDLLSLPRESNAVAKGRVAIIKAKTSVWFIVCHSVLEALYIYYYSYFSQQLSAVDFIITFILQMRRQAERSQMTCQASGSQWVLQLRFRSKRLGSQVLLLQCNVASTRGREKEKHGSCPPEKGALKGENGNS